MPFESPNDLPSYKNPPLVEVALSVVFEPVEGLTDAHLSPFWWTVRNSFPFVRLAHAIPTDLQSFELGMVESPGIQIELAKQLETRVLMTAEADDWVCQVQRNRLVVNWRKRSEAYPRFSATLSKLTMMWDGWKSFVESLGFERPKPVAWEVTYVNQIRRDFNRHGTWTEVLPGLFHDIPRLHWQRNCAAGERHGSGRYQGTTQSFV